MWTDDSIQCNHRGLQGSKMRVLIVCTAILAYANAAPSHLIPLAPLAVRTIGYPATIPTVSSGDIHAAAINAQVQYADLAQAAVDKARRISEQAVENLNVNAYSSITGNQEKLTDAFWATEDKKWQTLDAIRTAEAQLDGALASNAPALSKNAFVSPHVAGVASYTGFGPINPVVYPGFVAPATKSISNQVLIQTHPETSQAENSGNTAETGIKAAETSGSAAEASLKGAENIGNTAEASIKAAETGVNTADSTIETADTGMASGASETSKLDMSIKSAKLEQPDIVISMKTDEGGMNSAESAKLETDVSTKTAEGSTDALESAKSDIEKSVKSAEAALEAAKSEADKAFAALHSTVSAGTVSLTSAYLAPQVYSVALTQPILNPLQPIIPAVGQTYLKTLC